MISLRKAVKVTNIYTGVCWILYGCFNLIGEIGNLTSTLSVIVDILSVFFLIIGTVTTFYDLSKKIEPEDEMAKMNKANANEMTLRILMILMLMIALVTMLGDIVKIKIVIDYSLLFPFLYGVVNILIGYFFEKYEKEGV